MADRAAATTAAASPSPRPRERRGRAPTQAFAMELVDGRTLRVVQAVVRGGSSAISRVLTGPIRLPADADRTDAMVLGRALAATMDQLKLKPAEVVMGIPRAQVILRTLLLPVIADERELASVVHLQIARDLPFRFADAVVDFKVLREVPPPPARPEAGSKGVPSGDTPPAPAPVAKLEVLVAVVRREVVEFCRNVAAAAGCRLTALGLLPHASARCVAASASMAEGTDFALVSLRPDEVEIDIVAGGSLVFSRGAGLRTAGDGTAGEGAALVEAAAIEVVRSLHGYAGQGAAAPRGLFVTGATGHEGAVAVALAARLQRTVAPLDLAALGLPEDSRPAAAGAVAAMGLALGVLDAGGLPIDFLTPKRPAVQRDLRRLWTLAAVAVVAMLSLLVAAVRTWQLSKRQKILDEVNATVIAAEKHRPIYRQMIQQAAVVNEWVRGERDWLDHYAYLTAVLPPSEEIYLTSFAVSGQGMLRLAVRARSGQILAKLEKQLRAAGYEVKPLAITPGSDRNGYEFQSTVELVVPDKLKIDLTKVKPPPRLPDDASLDPVVKKGGG